MRSTPATPSETCALPARFAALWCLFAWFAGMPALLPAAVAMLGALDGQHRVSLAAERGQIAVIFRHSDAGEARTHRHSPLAGMLTTFAQSSGPTQDHLLAFTLADTARLALPVESWASSLHALSLPPAILVFPTPPPLDAPALAPCPPPTCAFALVCLRSTTLLI